MGYNFLASYEEAQSRLRLSMTCSGLVRPLRYPLCPRLVEMVSYLSPASQLAQQECPQKAQERAGPQRTVAMIAGVPGSTRLHCSQVYHRSRAPGKQSSHISPLQNGSSGVAGPGETSLFLEEPPTSEHR